MGHNLLLNNIDPDNSAVDEDYKLSDDESNDDGTCMKQSGRSSPPVTDHFTLAASATVDQPQPALLATVDQSLHAPLDNVNQSLHAILDTVDQSQPALLAAVDQSQPALLAAVDQSQPALLAGVDQSLHAILDNINQPPPPVSAIEDQSESQHKKTRKRKRNELEWKRFVQKKAYNCGEQVKRKKKITNMPETSKRVVRGMCMAEKCRRKCSTKIDEQQQDKINKAFWEMGLKERRHDFVGSNTEKQVVSTRTKLNNCGKSKPRNHSYYFFLPNIENERVSVCKNFFLNTLDISAAMVRQAHKIGIRGATPGRGSVNEKRGGHNKTKPDSLAEVKLHIESFPHVESHYCRSTRVCKYLEGALTISAMYRLYKDKCMSEAKEVVHESVYRSVFVNDYNLRFHKPSKDTCDSCCKFELRKKSNGGVLAAEEQAEYAAHIRRKEQARTSKIIDKEGTSDSKICAAMDLEQVLTVPKLSVGSAYYLRKLSMYNLTFYNLGTKEGSCYMWTESEAGRGANEIASALYHWLVEEDKKGAEQITVYSDTCAGQNRNRVVCSMIIVFLSRSVNTQKVEQKYFESGHSQMECDAIHSSIENKVRKRDIHLPSQYEEAARTARPKMPYKVISLNRENIYDWSAVNTVMRGNAFAGIITKHSIIYSRDDARDVAVSFSNEIGGVSEAVVYKKRGRNVNFSNMELTHAYTAPLGVDKNKKEDLLKLCAFLPNDCKPFYESLAVRN
jgi:hypothetical protein